MSVNFCAASVHVMLTEEILTRLFEITYDTDGRYRVLVGSFGCDWWNGMRCVGDDSRLGYSKFGVFVSLSVHCRVLANGELYYSQECKVPCDIGVSTGYRSGTN
jgi:hypothetical protein